MSKSCFHPLRRGVPWFATIILSIAFWLAGSDPIRASTLAFSSVGTTGSNLVVSGSGGVPGATYYVLASTNLTLSPVASWNRIATNIFSTNGQFTSALSIDASVPQEFIIIATTLPVTISSGISVNNKPYDGTTAATISSNDVVLDGVLPADAGNVRLSTNGYVVNFSSANVGTNIVVTVSGLSLTGSAAGNYMLVQPTLTGNINKGTPLVKTATTASGITYGQTLASSTVMAGVFTNLAGLTVPLDSSGFVDSTIAPNAGTTNVQVYYVPVDTADYNNVTNTVSVSVGKGTLVAKTATTASGITYGQTLASSTVTAGVFTNLAGLTVPLGSSGFVDSTIAPNAGTTNVQVYYVPVDTADYNNVTNTVSVSVGKGTLVAKTATTASGITYGQTLASSTVTAGVFTNLAGLTVPLGSSGFVDSTIAPNAGTTNVQVYYVPVDTADYNNVTNTVSVSVGKGTLVAKTATTASGITYGQTLASSTVTAGVFTNLAGLTVPLGSSGFVDSTIAPNAGTTNVQVYYVPVDTADYNNVTNTVSVSVGKAGVTINTDGITANNKVYDGTTVATLSSNNVVLAGVLPADAGNVWLSTNGYTATFASAGTNYNISVTVSGLTLTGSAAANYTLTPLGLHASISAAAVTVTSGLTANNKVYDGTTVATLSSNNVVLAGVLPADAGNMRLSTNGYVANFSNPNVGTNIAVTVSGLTLTGSAATNYTLTQPTGLAANITSPPPVPGLVAAYGFNEGSGTTVTDASGNGNNGTIGGATWTTSGKYGNALVFNGTSALVTINNSASLQLGTAMTLEAWVSPSTVSSAWRDVIYKGNDNYYLEGTSPTSGQPAAGGTFSGSPIYGTTALTANTWTHLAATYDGTTMRLYVNGVQVASQAQTGAIATSTNPLQIGGDSIYGQYFAGTIDEVRVYNVALTAAQIQSDTNTPLGNIPTAPGNLSATVISSNQVNLSWTASTGNLGVMGYLVERQGPGTGSFVQIGTTNGTSYADLGLVAGTNYSYRVRATDAQGDLGPYSSVVQAFTGFSIGPRVAVLTPTQTQQFRTNFTNVNVTWSVDGLTGGSATVGTITAGGLYAPPNSNGTHTVTATTTNPAQTASATVYVTTNPGVFTFHNDTFRTGQNANETVLSPADVNMTSFGKLFSYPLDGLSLASPLYVAGVTIPGKGTHNVVYVATEHDSVFAFDADGLTNGPLWQVSFINPGQGSLPCPRPTPARRAIFPMKSASPARR